MEVMAYLFFHIVKYIQVIIIQEKKVVLGLGTVEQLQLIVREE